MARGERERERLRPPLYTCVRARTHTLPPPICGDINNSDSLIAKVSLALNYVQHHECILWGGGVALPFLLLALDGVERSASRSACFTSGERAPSNHQIKGWLGLRDSLDIVEKILIYF
jgi:hypothetical protein